MERNEGWKLIGLGALFFLIFGTGFRFDNWWALFILIPALGFWASAYEEYKKTGYTPMVGAKISWGLPPALVASFFLLHLDWGRMWPLFIIMAGVVSLLNPYKLKQHQELKDHQYEQVK